MKLYDVIKSILFDQRIKDDDIKKSAILLINSCEDPKTIIAIAAEVKKMADYEKDYRSEETVCAAGAKHSTK
jgi:hypothetical protein